MIFAELQKSSLPISSLDSQLLGEKVRLFVFDASYIDVWLSRKLEQRFGFHWERSHIDGRSFRYDNFSEYCHGVTLVPTLAISTTAARTKSSPRRFRKTSPLASVSFSVSSGTTYG